MGFWRYMGLKFTFFMSYISAPNYATAIKFIYSECVEAPLSNDA